MANKTSLQRGIWLFYPNHLKNIVTITAKRVWSIALELSIWEDDSISAILNCPTSRRYCIYKNLQRRSEHSERCNERREEGFSFTEPRHGFHHESHTVWILAARRPIKMGLRMFRMVGMTDIWPWACLAGTSFYWWCNLRNDFVYTPDIYNQAYSYICGCLFHWLNALVSNYVHSCHGITGFKLFSWTVELKNGCSPSTLD